MIRPHLWAALSLLVVGIAEVHTGAQASAQAKAQASAQEGAREAVHPDPQSADDALPEPLTHYFGREIARTMHWTGAEWLLRKTREEQENGQLAGSFNRAILFLLGAPYLVFGSLAGGIYYQRVRGRRLSAEKPGERV